MASVDPQNPYLDVQHPIAFDRMTAEHVRPAVASLLRDAQQRLDALQHDTSPASFENTLLALEDVTERLGRAMGVIGHLESVANTPALRDAYNEVQPLVSAFYSSIPLSSGVYRRIKEFAGTDAVKRLDPTRSRFLHKTIESFEREGAGLDDAGKARLQAIERGALGADHALFAERARRDQRVRAVHRRPCAARRPARARGRRRARERA